MEKEQNQTANVLPLLVRSQDKKAVLPLYGMYIDKTTARYVSLNFLTLASAGLNNYYTMGNYRTEEEALEAMDKILAAQLGGEKFIQL